MSELRGPCVRLLRSRKPRRERTLVGREGSDPVGRDDPCAGGPKCRPDARAHFAFLRLPRDEHSAKSGYVVARIDRVVVRPAARPIVLYGTTQLRRHCRAYCRWIGPCFERDRYFVNIRSEPGCRHAGKLRRSELVEDLVSVVDLVVVRQAAARDCAGVERRFTRRGRVARLGCPIDLLVAGVFFELDVDFDLLVAFDVVGHARSVPVDGSCETRVVCDCQKGMPLVARTTGRYLFRLGSLPVGLQPKKEGIAKNLAQ